MLDLFGFCSDIKVSAVCIAVYLLLRRDKPHFVSNHPKGEKFIAVGGILLGGIVQLLALWQGLSIHQASQAGVGVFNLTINMLFTYFSVCSLSRPSYYYEPSNEEEAQV